MKLILKALFAIIVFMVSFFGASYAFGDSTTKAAIASTASEIPAAISGKVTATMAPVTPKMNIPNLKVDDVSAQVEEVKAQEATYNGELKKALESVDGWDPNVVEKVQVPTAGATSNEFSMESLLGVSSNWNDFYKSFAGATSKEGQSMNQMMTGTVALATFFVVMLIAFGGVAIKFHRH